MGGLAWDGWKWEILISFGPIMKQKNLYLGNFMA